MLFSRKYLLTGPLTLGFDRYSNITSFKDTFSNIFYMTGTASWLFTRKDLSRRSFTLSFDRYSHPISYNDTFSFTWLLLHHSLRSLLLCSNNVMIFFEYLAVLLLSPPMFMWSFLFCLSWPLWVTWYPTCTPALIPFFLILFYSILSSRAFTAKCLLLLKVTFNPFPWCMLPSPLGRTYPQMSHVVPFGSPFLRTYSHSRFVRNSWLLNLYWAY